MGHKKRAIRAGLALAHPKNVGRQGQLPVESCSEVKGGHGEGELAQRGLAQY